jgi:hypothetical protein
VRAVCGVHDTRSGKQVGKGACPHAGVSNDIDTSQQNWMVFILYFFELTLPYHPYNSVSQNTRGMN